MALDPNKLSRNELVQLLNSTTLGESITRSRLDRQMNRAGRRWHDGRHVRLLDYLRWPVPKRDISRFETSGTGGKGRGVPKARRAEG